MAQPSASVHGGATLAGYLLGSIPVAYLVARSRDVNILQAGTQNPGAANVFRTVSRPLAAPILSNFRADGGRGPGTMRTPSVLTDRLDAEQNASVYCPVGDEGGRHMPSP